MSTAWPLALASEVESVCRLRRARRQLGRVACRAGTRKFRTSSRRPSPSIRFSMTARQSRVDLVKIDIEGAEAEAIRGMAAGHRAASISIRAPRMPPGRARADGRRRSRQCLAPFRRAGYRGWHIDHSPRCIVARRAARCRRRNCSRRSTIARSRRISGHTFCGRLPVRPCRRECVSRTSACPISSAAPRSSCSR